MKEFGESQKKWKEGAKEKIWTTYYGY